MDLLHAHPVHGEPGSAGLLRRRLASRRAGHRRQPRGGALPPAGVRAGKHGRTAWRKARAAASLHFHLLDALESMPDLFLKFGGHKHAAGLTMQADRVKSFARALMPMPRRRLGPEDFLPRLEIDALIDFAEIHDRSVDEIFRLAPFGYGNPAPVFAALDAEVLAAPVIWKEKHLKLAIRQNGRHMSLKAWNFAEWVGRTACGPAHRRGIHVRRRRLLRGARRPALGCGAAELPSRLAVRGRTSNKFSAAGV